MSARRQIIAALSEDSMGGIATLHDVAHAEQLVDAHQAEVLATDGQAYDGELSMLRGLVRTLRVVVRHDSDLAEVWRLLVEHTRDDAAAREEATAAAATATPADTAFDPLPSYLHAIGQAGSQYEREMYAAYRQAIAEVGRLQAEAAPELNDRPARTLHTGGQ